MCCRAASPTPPSQGCCLLCTWQPLAGYLHRTLLVCMYVRRRRGDYILVHTYRTCLTTNVRITRHGGGGSVLSSIPSWEYGVDRQRNLGGRRIEPRKGHKFCTMGRVCIYDAVRRALFESGREDAVPPTQSLSLKQTPPCLDNSRQLLCPHGCRPSPGHVRNREGGKNQACRREGEEGLMRSVSLRVQPIIPHV